jgi:hypothetical protein
MLDVIFGSDSHGATLGDDVFGVRLNSNNVAERYREFYRNRLVFLQKNPWFHDDLIGVLKDLANGMR